MAQYELTARPRGSRATASGQAAGPRLRLFGVFRLECVDGARDVPVNEQRLLAYLGLHKRASRTVVAGALWPDVTEERAHGSLRTALWRLRRARQPVVGSDGDTLCLADGVSVDVDAFTEVALGLVTSGHVLGDDPPSLDLLDGGELLPGWDEEWILFERERLRQLRLHSLESLSALLARNGQYALALEAALMCVTIEPLRESAHRALVAVHLAENNVVEAIRRYEAFRRLLDEDLGLEPSAQFTGMLPRWGSQPRPRAL